MAIGSAATATSPVVGPSTESSLPMSPRSRMVTVISRSMPGRSTAMPRMRSFCGGKRYQRPPATNIGSPRFAGRGITACGASSTRAAKSL
jgi:hypothetical protein